MSLDEVTIIHKGGQTVLSKANDETRSQFADRINRELTKVQPRVNPDIPVFGKSHLLHLELTSSFTSFALANETIDLLPNKRDSTRNLYVFGPFDPVLVGYANPSFTEVLPEDNEDKMEKQKSLTVVNLRGELTDKSERKVKKGKVKVVTGSDILELL